SLPRHPMESAQAEPAFFLAQTPDQRCDGRSECGAASGNHRRPSTRGVTLLLLLFCLPPALRAQLSKEDREAAQKMISGTLYLRLQAPQKYGMGLWAPYSVSMLEASPEGVSAERKLAEPLKSIPRNGYHLKQEEVYWGYLANTPVNHCK